MDAHTCNHAVTNVSLMAIWEFRHQDVFVTHLGIQLIRLLYLHVDMYVLLFVRVKWVFFNYSIFFNLLFVDTLFCFLATRQRHKEHQWRQQCERQSKEGHSLNILSFLLLITQCSSYSHTKAMHSIMVHSWFPFESIWSSSYLRLLGSKRKVTGKQQQPCIT